MAPFLSSSYSASDDELPTVDYSLLFSEDPAQRFVALEFLRHACEEFGFFYLVNHTIPATTVEGILKGVCNFFDPTTLNERKMMYSRKGPLDTIKWGLNSSFGENREYLKLFSHPHLYAPFKPASFSNILEEYTKEMRIVLDGLAKAISKTLGFEENYIEKAFNLKSGFDVMSMNLYPANSRTKGPFGFPQHTDPGFVIALTQDVDGGLQILSHQGKWINCHIPHHAILIQLGDQLEVLTNGKYKSHIHRVTVDNNKIERISVVTLHGPSLHKVISPGKEFVDDEHPKKYHEITYKESLEGNGLFGPIDLHSSIAELRLPKV